MAGAQKFIVAVFVACMFVLSATNVPQAEAAYRECFDTCFNPCMQSGRTLPICENRCETECTAKEFKDMKAKRNKMTDEKNQEKEMADEKNQEKEMADEKKQEKEMADEKKQEKENSSGEM